MSTEIEVNNCFAIGLFNFEFHFVVEIIFNLKTFSQVLATVTKKIL